MAAAYSVTPLLFFTTLFLLFAQPIFSSDPPAYPPSPSSSPSPSYIFSPAPAPSPAYLVSPPAPPLPDLNPNSPPSPAPSPSEGDDDDRDQKSPSPSPAVVGDKDQSAAGNLEYNDDDKGGGMNGGKKAGVAIGVLAGVCVVGLGALVYKKRQDNIRRSQYGYAARREIL